MTKIKYPRAVYRVTSLDIHKHRQYFFILASSRDNAIAYHDKRHPNYPAVECSELEGNLTLQLGIRG